MDENVLKVFGATALLIAAVFGSAVISTEIHSGDRKSESFVSHPAKHYQSEPTRFFTKV